MVYYNCHVAFFELVIGFLSLFSIVPLLSAGKDVTSWSFAGLAYFNLFADFIWRSI